MHQKVLDYHSVDNQDTSFACPAYLWNQSNNRRHCTTATKNSLLQFSSMIPAVKTHCTASVIQHALAVIGVRLETKNATKTTFWKYISQFAIPTICWRILKCLDFLMRPACCGILRVNYGTCFRQRIDRRAVHGNLWETGQCSKWCYDTTAGYVTLLPNRDTLTMIHLVEVYSHGLGISATPWSSQGRAAHPPRARCHFWASCQLSAG